MALMSGKVYSNTGAPSNADGVDGDIYLRLDGMKTTYRKESGAWVAVGSTLGAIPEIISGVGAPSNALGADEQYYRDTGSQNIYYKQGSTWNLVGNLKGASFGPILDQAGVGKDLATAPNLIPSGSLNAVTTVGEYYYINTVTDTPSPYGLMKVWRENSTGIYQLVQSAGSGGKLYNRYTTDGGVNWGPWIEYAGVNGDVLVDFQVSGGTGDNSAVCYTQLVEGFSEVGDGFTLPELYGSWKLKWGVTAVGDIVGNEVTHTTSISGFTAISNVLVGSASPTGNNSFVVHRQSFDNSGVTVVLRELVSEVQSNAGYWWLAIGK